VEHVLPTIEDLALDSQVELVEETILHRKSKTTRQGKNDLWKIRLK
jgi:hypothetical protein